jgi:hypothetical protein
MVDKVALGEVFLRKFRFSRIIIFPPMLILIIVYWHSCRKEKTGEGWETEKFSSDLSEIGKLCVEEVLSDLLEWVQL